MALVWHLLLSFGILLLWGGILTGVVLLLPRVLDYFAPASLGAPLGVAPSSRPAPPPPPSPPPPGPAEPRPAPEPPPVRLTAPPEDPDVAAVVAVALALYLEETPEPAAAPVPPGAASGSIWALSGRWQIMQQRRNLPKRS